MVYLLLFRNALELSHVLAHLAKIAFGIAAMVLLLLLVNRFAGRASGSGRSVQKRSGKTSKEQRRR